MIESLLYRFLAQMSRDVSVEVPDTAEGNEYVRKAIEYIQTNYMRPIRVHDIAEHVNINRGYLYALFKKEMNMSPQEYLTNLRLTRAAEQLNTTNTPVEQIAQANGYNDPVVFSKAFKKMHGTSPSRYRQNTADKSRDSMKLKESGKDTLQ
jgi:AraC family transcriptional regulator of arabinose operon